MASTPVAQAPVRRRAERARRAAARLLAYATTAILVFLAAGSAAGRFRVVGVPEGSAAVPYTVGDLVVVVPAHARSIEPGDVVIVRGSGERGLFRVAEIVDAEGPQVRFAGDRPDRIRRLPATTWRASRVIPHAGLALRLVSGPAQAAVLVVLGLGLIVGAEVRRTREIRGEAAATAGDPA